MLESARKNPRDQRGFSGCAFSVNDDQALQQKRLERRVDRHDVFVSASTTANDDWPERLADAVADQGHQDRFAAAIGDLARVDAEHRVRPSINRRIARWVQRVRFSRSRGAQTNVVNREHAIGRRGFDGFINRCVVRVAASHGQIQVATASPLEQRVFRFPTLKSIKLECVSNVPPISSLSAARVRPAGPPRSEC